MKRYKDAGVNQRKKDKWLERIQKIIRSTYSKDVLPQKWPFAGAFSISSMLNRYTSPVLVACCDGVGTKLIIAQMLNKHDTVGIDLVAMNVNDLITTGATPLFFLDYIATGKVNPWMLTQIMKGITRGCKMAECSLLGGETAEMPGFYHENQYELAGFCAGIVDKKRIIKPNKIKAGDAVIGLHSNGLHSNGFSLVRKIFLEKARIDLGKCVPELSTTLGEELLKPTTIYVKTIKTLLEKFVPSFEIKAIAHITGGGMVENIPRVLPAGYRVVIQKKLLPRMPIFDLIKKIGRVPEQEMFEVFNMGIGLVIIVPEKLVGDAMAQLNKCKQRATLIGRVARGTPSVKIV